jgi:hypothetical protein
MHEFIGRLKLRKEINYLTSITRYPNNKKKEYLVYPQSQLNLIGNVLIWTSKQLKRVTTEDIILLFHGPSNSLRG